MNIKNVLRNVRIKIDDFQGHILSENQSWITALSDNINYMNTAADYQKNFLTFQQEFELQKFASLIFVDQCLTLFIINIHKDVTI